MYSWGWKVATGPLVDYPELRRPIGPPMGAYTRTTPDGCDFTSELEHASVWVNTETREDHLALKFRLKNEAPTYL
ncbi:hypothetical protein [Rubritalea sp.]|uniref:hypothetical protein n=1 Tax=Rubritalea sp. TaxID=2109375 RepID=UPI003EF8F948